jgi:hypothetical protein
MPTFSQRQVLLVISCIIIFGGLLLVIPLRLLPSLLAGLLVFELVNMLTPQLQRLIEGARALAGGGVAGHISGQCADADLRRRHQFPAARGGKPRRLPR